MSKIKYYFEKAGGTKLLKQYWRAGVLHTAIIQFLLLGRSETALRLLRLIVSMKTQEKLKKKYKKVLDKFDEEYEEKDHVASQKIWIFWWQGMENAPALVQRCYNSVKEHLLDWEIILITEQNYEEYVSFPDHILQKMRKGIISFTHFSDLLRLELLINHGGLWLDATVLCTSGDIPQSILKSDLFVYQTQKPGANGRASILSNWLIYSKTNNAILRLTLCLLYEYWKRNDKLVDYFIFHHFFSIACKKYSKEASQIFPYDNSIPHLLLLHLFDNFDKEWWEEWKRLTCFHKLSYKLNKEDMEKKGTYYDVIIKGNLF